jgi:ABC-type phosphate transport system ATPase subunit
MDEPAASLDPTSTAELEDSIIAMKGAYTVVVVTHDIGEARRVSDYTAYLSAGQVVEFGETEVVCAAERRDAARTWADERSQGRSSEAAPGQTLRLLARVDELTAS